MTLRPVVGHTELQDRLRRAADLGRIPQSLLFRGQPGIGKQRLALWLAALLHCEDRVDRPCGRCTSCRLADDLQHPDIHWFFPLPSPKKVSGDRRRQKLEEARLEELQSRREHPLWPTTGDASASIFLPIVSEIRARAVRRPAMGSSSVFVVGDAERMVFGGVTFIAWQGDLDGGGGGRPQAVNFWLPPLIQIPLMGTAQACSEVSTVLENSGFRTTVKKEDFHGAQSAATGLLSTFVAGYELSGWSFGAYRRSPWLKQAARACREAILSQLSKPGTFTKRLLAVLPLAMVFHLVTFFLPLVFPFDLEKYLKFHYQKTRDQTLSLLDVFIKDGQSRSVGVGNIQTLLKGLHDSF